MDSASPNQQSTEPQGVVLKHSNAKKGLLEIILIVILLAITLVLLNYLNILPLSNIFPNQLGWLPHKSEESNQTANTTNPATISPHVSLLEQAKEAFMAYLPTILAPSLIPLDSGILLKQDNLDKQKFEASWQAQTGTASASFVVAENSLKVSQFQLLLPFDNNKIASIDLAQKTIPQFFSIQPEGTWGCNILSNGANYCENFWEKDNGDRQGVGVVGALPTAIKNKTSSITYCYRNKQSNIHSWKSCNAEL